MRILSFFAAALVAISMLATTASAEGLKRLQNRWKPDQMIHIEHGQVQVGQVQPGWWSAMWSIDPIPGTNFVRIRNHWKGDQYLHVEHGQVQSGQIQNGWWSAMWTLQQVQ
ncbi:RICIN domain-containing protein [Antarctobacter heliothermus]|uniref:Secreted protein n=1 Tax=Antarctobacter heliothermus TaxID=74033 RepID=A0A239C2Z4_9RHOB|nr:hypothetical protein [Antarctobacter heliothermus]SNS13784.1 hypothetical protein SAMN04488078_100555 [Antarctobacter heliothermus]